jgi:hypothetical protein
MDVQKARLTLWGFRNAAERKLIMAAKLRLFGRKAIDGQRLRLESSVRLN